MLYPFRKVSLISPLASTCSMPKDDPDVARLVAMGYRVFREWEVTGPRQSRTIWAEPM